MVVADTSAVVEYLLDVEASDWVAERLSSEPSVHAPHLLDIEVAAVLRRLVRMKKLSSRRAREALDDLVDLRVTRYGHVPFLARMWQLRDKVSARDAAFVALAEALGAPLLTTDRRLARASGLLTQVLVP